MQSEKKYDRALEEVWEWRKKAQKEYDSLKSLSPEERCRKINENNERFLREHKIDLPKIIKKV